MITKSITPPHCMRNHLKMAISAGTGYSEHIPNSPQKEQMIKNNGTW